MADPRFPRRGTTLKVGASRGAKNNDPHFGLQNEFTNIHFFDSMRICSTWPCLAASFHVFLTECQCCLLHVYYRSGTLNSNTVNSKFHLIRSFFQILARILSFHV